MNLALHAMHFFRELHKGQVRKYTGNPYHDHLAEVAGIVVTVAHELDESPQVVIATAWGHDSIEDQDVDLSVLDANFGAIVTSGIVWLSDTPHSAGNRARRKALDRQRLAKAPGWVQTVKCADVISNTGSIVKHDPEFAFNVYLPEKRALLEVLDHAHPALHRMAWNLVNPQL